MRSFRSKTNLDQGHGNNNGRGRNIPNVEDVKVNVKDKRIRLSNPEVNTVFGGGITGGSLTLLGGLPGVGKSTLLLQIATEIAGQGRVLYVSGEENEFQVSQRARRLGLENLRNVELLCTNDLDEVVDAVVNPRRREGMGGDDFDRVKMVILDSMQTMVTQEVGGVQGGVTQVRGVTSVMMRLAKGTDTPVIMVGHVTKAGNVAGPKTVEHMVDTVMILERGQGGVRVARVEKNR